MTDADQDRYRLAMQALWATFPTAELLPTTLAVYWQTLAPVMDIDAFEATCRNLMLSDSDFPPRPHAFLKAHRSRLRHKRPYKALADPEKVFGPDKATRKRLRAMFGLGQGSPEPEKNLPST